MPSSGIFKALFGIEKHSAVPVVETQSMAVSVPITGFVPEVKKSSINIKASSLRSRLVAVIS